MSAQSLQVITVDVPNPQFNAGDDTPRRINGSISFTYVTALNLLTLSTKSVSPGEDVTGLLYTPDLDPDDPCANASAEYIPADATRRANLPRADYDLVALAPWLSPPCVQAYLASARRDPVRGFLWFLPNDTSTDKPPAANSNVWALGDGGAWKRESEFGVYAIPGASAHILAQASAQYSKNMTDVPHGHTLTEYNDPRDYVRLYVNIDTAGANSTLPSLWVFLLIIIGILLGVIAATSLLMHWLQRRRRETLRRRVASGEVDLEALGIKRLTVPQAILNEMPLFVYGSGTPISPIRARKTATTTTFDKLESGAASPSPSPGPHDPPRPSLPTRTHSFHPTPLQQPTCAICLDDFVPASERSPGTVVRSLPCHHIFHPECVDIFLRDNSSLCPMCKKTALPRGYCPRVVTNAMVRRERTVRRIRERIGDDPAVAAAAGEHHSDATAAAVDPGTASGRRMRAPTFARWSLPHHGRRSSAPAHSVHAQPMSEMTPVGPVAAPPAAVLRSNSVTSASTPSSLPPPAQQSRVQPSNQPGRTEWARQRALSMLGSRVAPTDPDDEEQQTTSKWRKALRGVFPGVGH